MVDERASGHATNPMVSPSIEHMKENLRQHILDSAEQKDTRAGKMAIGLLLLDIMLLSSFYLIIIE